MTEAKKFWIITFANLVVAVFLALILYATMLALAAIAPEISVWPLFTATSIGLVLSIVALWLTRRLTTRWWRISGYVLHGCIFAINLAIVLGMAALYFGSVTEKFVIPEGYIGDVYVIFNSPGGAPEVSTPWQVTYVIPADGILRTRGSTPPDFTRSEYFYRRKDGTSEKIRNFWPTTIPETPENLSNDSDIGIFFPRTGTLTYSNVCSVQFEQFYVGTKAFLLTNYKEKDLSEYFQEHPDACTRRIVTPDKR